MRFVRSAPMSLSVSQVVLATIAFTFPGQAAFAQESLTAKSLEGVWKVTKIVQAGVTDSNPQPGLLIFTRGYYSAGSTAVKRANKRPRRRIRHTSPTRKRSHFIMNPISSASAWI